MSLQTVILAGGLGTRLSRLTKDRPKPLVEVLGEPFLAHQLRLLRAGGIDRVLLSVGYKGEMIREQIGDGAQFGLRVEYAFDGPTLLGTAGAIRAALPFLEEEFFVLYGDSYLPCDYAAIDNAFRHSGKAALMTVYRNEGQFDTSNVQFHNGEVIAYDKADRTPRMLHIDYGLGAFKRGVFASLPEGEVFDLAALYKQLLLEGNLAAFEVKVRFYEIGSEQGISDLEAYLIQNGVTA